MPKKYKILRYEISHTLYARLVSSSGLIRHLELQGFNQNSFKEIKVINTYLGYEFTQEVEVKEPFVYDKDGNIRVTLTDYQLMTELRNSYELVDFLKSKGIRFDENTEELKRDEQNCVTWIQRKPELGVDLLRYEKYLVWFMETFIKDYILEISDEEQNQKYAPHNYATAYAMPNVSTSMPSYATSTRAYDLYGNFAQNTQKPIQPSPKSPSEQARDLFAQFLKQFGKP